MDIVVRGRHLDVSARFREHVADKLSRADRFGLPITGIDVEVSHENNPRQADRAFEIELTCKGKGPVVRAEASAQDKYAALDMALARLEERLRRAADKKRHHKHVRPQPLPPIDLAVAPVSEAPEEADVEDEREAPLPDGTVWAEGPMIVREKTHASGRMSVGEAVEAMELVGHDFFLFQDSDTGLPSVVYRRRGFDYGLLRLENEGEADQQAV